MEKIGLISDSVLVVCSNVLYLTEHKTRSRSGGHFFVSEDIDFPSNTGSVETIAKLIWNVVTSAADAEIGALFINTRQSLLVRYLLKEMGHLQPPTPIQTEDTTALGFVTNNLQVLAIIPYQPLRFHACLQHI